MTGVTHTLCELLQWCRQFGSEPKWAKFAEIPCRELPAHGGLKCESRPLRWYDTRHETLEGIGWKQKPVKWQGAWCQGCGRWLRRRKYSEDVPE